jgi:hypothetical protein
MSKTFLYRVTFDVEVRARPLTRAFLEQHDGKPKGIGALAAEVLTPRSIPTERELAPQRALQAELRRDEAFLHAWMASEVLQCIQEGYVVVDDLDVEEPHGVLPALAEHLPAPSRLAVLEAERDPMFAAFVDEFWSSFSTVFGRIEIGVVGVLPPTPDTVVGRRFRAVVPLMVEVGEAHDVTVERCLRRRFDAAREQFFIDGAEEAAVPAWSPPLPSESELEHTRALLTAAHAAPRTLDHLIRLGIVADIRDGLRAESPTPSMGLAALRPLIDRLAPGHRARLLRHSLEEDWTDRVYDLCASFEEDTIAITISSASG